ncbi:MAG: hypothetical protein R2865_11005 [Deinococcales bacterium]
MTHPLAGQPAPLESLSSIPRLIAHYYSLRPDPKDISQRVSFGTSGHRGISSQGSFNEAHILAVAQATAEYRQQEGITGPLFIGMDTHALSEAAHISALEVFAAHDIEIVMQKDFGYTPTPVISHAILNFNRKNKGLLADGVVITPSHNPPDNGGFKYNPPNGGLLIPAPRLDRGKG